MSDLFDSFDRVSEKEWKQKIQFDLKGADYNDTLIWNSPEGIDVKPFYHSDSLSGRSYSSVNSTDFSICEQVLVKKPNKALNHCKKALSNGSDSILFKFGNDSQEDISGMISEIPEGTRIFFRFNELPDLKLLSALTENNPGRINLNIDLIGNLARTGNWYESNQRDHEILKSISDSNKGFESVIGIDTGLYQNAGANMVQQLAYGLGHFNEYLNFLNGDIHQKVVFEIAVGSNYFFEISKIRAFRWLIDSLCAEYNLNLDYTIFAQPSKRNKTIYDYNTNMLRTTTECMSAVLGGADVICNQPYDALYHKPNDFGNRISRNQLLILKNESYFNIVDNPVDGSYYLETITEQLAVKALEVFKEIEHTGGFLKSLFDGTIQRKIRESADLEQSKFDREELVLLGTNKYVNLNDRMENELQLFPFVKKHKRKTIIEPIIEKRLAEANEKKRLESE